MRLPNKGKSSEKKDENNGYLCVNVNPHKKTASPKGCRAKEYKELKIYESLDF